MNRWPKSGLRQSAALLAAGVLALVAACGGGGDSSMPAATTPNATATSYSQGPISGFGSVIVNGVRWDDSAASVSDDDGVAHSRSDLKLGMMVEIDGDGVDHGTGSGKALAFRFGSETTGPITGIDLTASTMTVLGLTIQVTTSTVFADTISGGLPGLAAGDVVEVFGLFDAANTRVVATRVDLRNGALEYRLRGTISALDKNAKTFMLGSELISYGTVSSMPPDLANGLQVKTHLQTTRVGGAWVAKTVRVILRQPVPNRPDAEVEGVITAWTSAMDFELNGLKVDATNANFPDGTSGVVLGASVDVKGSVKDGVLVATSVQLQDDGHHGGGKPREFELHGTVSKLDTTAKTFALRGLTVSYAGNVKFEDGSADKLANGVKVEVKGTLSTDLTMIVATKIEFEH